MISIYRKLTRNSDNFTILIAAIVTFSAFSFSPLSKEFFLCHAPACRCGSNLALFIQNDAVGDSIPLIFLFRYVF